MGEEWQFVLFVKNSNTKNTFTKNQMFVEPEGRWGSYVPILHGLGPQDRQHFAWCQTVEHVNQGSCILGNVV